MPRRPAGGGAGGAGLEVPGGVELLGDGRLGVPAAADAGYLAEATLAVKANLHQWTPARVPRLWVVAILELGEMAVAVHNHSRYLSVLGHAKDHQVDRGEHRFRPNLDSGSRVPAVGVGQNEM